MAEYLPMVRRNTQPKVQNNSVKGCRRKKESEVWEVIWEKMLRIIVALTVLSNRDAAFSYVASIRVWPRGQAIITLGKD
ncbi:hypothetical protein NQ317_006909 [Molorchus minor]|uniref:Uncharacterized protein n=1 Tax=Molorchus minor TaxID=1323400 RepID=A0ABQ9J6B8_9CUCU|nr:hypothetical protein NQ317_006909 [Molorchus minor]